MIRNGNIDPNCADMALRWSTAHMRAVNFADWAEIGWNERWGPISSHLFRVFWETGVGLQETDSGYISVGCCAWSYFKVLNDPAGSDKWSFFFDYNKDGVWEWQVLQKRVLNMVGGYPQGETGRRGQLDAYDHHRNLRYRNSSYVWKLWQGMSEQWDDIDDYHCHWDTNTEYEVHVPDTRHQTSPPGC